MSYVRRKQRHPPGGENQIIRFEAGQDTITPSSSGDVKVIESSTTGTLTAHEFYVEVHDPLNCNSFISGERGRAIWRTDARRWEIIGRHGLFRKAIANAGIAGGASGLVTIYLNGASTGVTVTAHNNWDGGDISSSQKVFIQYFPDESKWIVLGLADTDSAASWYKPLIRFTLAAALTTADASKTGTIQNQYGPGTSNPNTGSGAITVFNMLRVDGSTYDFTGSNGDVGYARWDSGNNYRIIHMELQPYKPIIDFALTAALGTNEASESATIVAQFGHGRSNPNTSSGAITVYNLETSTAGVYLFEGVSGAKGRAAWDSGNNYRILNMECPQQ